MAAFRESLSKQVRGPSSRSKLGRHELPLSVFQNKMLTDNTV